MWPKVGYYNEEALHLNQWAQAVRIIKEDVQTLIILEDYF